MIKLEMNDWLYNSGLLGLYRVLKHNNDYVKVKDNYIEFEESSLENFGDKFFNYLIDKYENHLSYTKIVKKAKKLINTFDEESFDKDKLESLNKDIEFTKNKLKSASYVSAYIILNDEKLATLEKSLKKVQLKNKQEIVDVIDDVKAQLKILQEIVDYMSDDEVKRVLASKDVIYSVIAKFYSNVSFLNANSNKIDMRDEYNRYFTTSATNYIDYLNKDKKKVAYSCCSCDSDIESKKQSFGLAWLNNIGVDTNRKTSHFWNLNAQYICPMCNLVYSCVAIGFNVLKGDGLFINQNSSFEKMIKANNSSVNDSDTLEQLENKSYYAIIESIEQDKVEALDKEINNIQVVKLNNDKYQFNILSKEMLTIMSDNKDKLEKMINSYAKIENEFYNLHKEVLKKLYSNRNLFDLIYKLLKSNYSNSYMINNILLINNEIMNMKQGDVIMTNKQIKYVKNLGVELKAKYVSLNATNKIEAITHRLLNSIRTNDKNRFSETIIKAHMYVNSQISDVFVNALSDDENLKTLGYAFVLGLQGYNKKNEEAQN